MFLPGESHGWRSLAGYSPRDREESDTTEVIVHTWACTHGRAHTHTQRHARVPVQEGTWTVCAYSGEDLSRGEFSIELGQRSTVSKLQLTEVKRVNTIIPSPMRGGHQFSRSVMFDSLQPHGLQHARLPCPSLTPGHKLMSIQLVMLSNHLILCRPLLLLPSAFPSIRVFSCCRAQQCVITYIP